MHEPYSRDMRERAVALLDEGASSPEVARTLRKLRNALRWALLEISSNDALGYFSHCGFRVPCQ